VKEKKISGIVDLRDDRYREGIASSWTSEGRIAGVVLTSSIMHTQIGELLRASSILAIDGDSPACSTSSEILQRFIDFRREIVIRRTTFRLGPCQERGDTSRKGSSFALGRIDEIIAVIRLPAPRRCVRRPDPDLRALEVQAKRSWRCGLQRAVPAC
jgi:DNA gyrase subunit A